jgi:hypothetical protein
MTAAAVVLSVLGIGLAGAGWRTRAGTAAGLAVTAAMVVVLGLVAVLVLAAGPPAAWGELASRWLLVLLSALAVAGGGPLAVSVLAVADDAGWRWPPFRAPSTGPRTVPRTEPRTEPLDPVGDGEVLRGGAWIGSLERAGIFATLVAGWPEGVAVVLAVKGVGRYQELSGNSDAAERFIIGTFASVLWACACAGVWWFGS